VTSGVQLAAILVSLTLLVVVLDLVRRRKLSEEYSVVWIVCAAALLVLSIWRDSLHVVAGWLGVFYPPAVLLLVLVLFVFLACLAFSVVISRQSAQIERLAEEVAILSAREREARAAAARETRDA
jgi:hypothetical protein